MNSGTFGHGAYSSSSGLTSPTSCYSLDDEWGPSNQASWFGPTGWPPNQTRPSSPGLQMFRTLSLPDAQEGSRRSSLLDPVQAPVSSKNREKFAPPNQAVSTAVFDAVIPSFHCAPRLLSSSIVMQRLWFGSNNDFSGPTCLRFATVTVPNSNLFATLRH